MCPSKVLLLCAVRGGLHNGRVSLCIHDFTIDNTKSIPASNFADDPELLHWRCTGRQLGRQFRAQPTKDSTHTPSNGQTLAPLSLCSQHALSPIVAVTLHPSALFAPANPHTPAHWQPPARGRLLPLARQNAEQRAAARPPRDRYLDANPPHPSLLCVVSSSSCRPPLLPLPPTSILPQPWRLLGHSRVP